MAHLRESSVWLQWATRPGLPTPVEQGDSTFPVRQRTSKQDEGHDLMKFLLGLLKLGPLPHTSPTPTWQ